MSYGSKLKPRQRHSSQDRTLALLLDQAFRIKEEVAGGPQSTKGSIQVDALSHKLLESHVVTITQIVQQLSMGIQALEGQIAKSDSVALTTTLAVQSLDQKNVAVVGDLRGRVARWDASIAKLSTGVSSGEQHMIRLQQEVAELRSAMDVRLKELEVKVSLQDVRWPKGSQQQLNATMQTHAQSSQQIRSRPQDQVIETESRFAERLRGLEARVEQFEKQLDQAERNQGYLLKRSETKLSKRMTSVENSLHQELQLLKQEYHKGFLSVHDANESLKQIGDIKSRLDKEKLQKDFRHICSQKCSVTSD